MYRGVERLEGPGGRRIDHGDVVRADHAAVKEFPGDFAPIPVGCRLWPDPQRTGSSPSEPQAGRVAAPSSPASPSPKKYPWTVVLREQPTRRYEIKLGESTVRSIMEEARVAGHEGYEVGGYLWARNRPGREQVSVVYANGPGGDRATRRPR